MPHNAPMWRRETHLALGGFASRDTRRSCYDFSFWLRMLRSGAQMRHLNEPLEMYLSRTTSLGHRTHAYAVDQNKYPWHDWVNECDPPEGWDANVYKLRATAWEGVFWQDYNANLANTHGRGSVVLTFVFLKGVALGAVVASLMLVRGRRSLVRASRWVHQLVSSTPVRYTGLPASADPGDTKDQCL